MRKEIWIQMLGSAGGKPFPFRIHVCNCNSHFFSSLLVILPYISVFMFSFRHLVIFENPESTSVEVHLIDDNMELFIEVYL